jgi:hypothetical protein
MNTKNVPSISPITKEADKAISSNMGAVSVSNFGPADKAQSPTATDIIIPEGVTAETDNVSGCSGQQFPAIIAAESLNNINPGDNEADVDEEDDSWLDFKLIMNNGREIKVCNRCSMSFLSMEALRDHFCYYSDI